jgi:hypothetical protein
MYWMLLPPSANAGRHVEDDLPARNGYWSDLFLSGWDKVLQLLALNQH